MKKNMTGLITGTARGLHLAGGVGAALLNKQMQDYLEDFRRQRIACYEEDRLATLQALDPKGWKRFSLRWNIAPAFPHGWGSDDELLVIMHKTRLALAFSAGATHFGGFTTDELDASGEWLTERNVDLPTGLFFTGNGKVVGEVKPPSSSE